MIFEFDREMIPLPRLWAFSHWGADERNTSISFGLEVSDRYGDPLINIGFEFPWRRPRPWHIEGSWPTKWPDQKHAPHHRRFRWRQPA